MTEIRAAICDDEKMATDIMSSAIMACFQGNGVELKLDKFNSQLELEKKIKADESYYQLIFLDIDMPKIDGISLAKRLRSLIKDTPIIFVSNREDKVFDTFSVQPFGFIRKSKFLEDVNPVIKMFISTVFDSDRKNTCINFKTANGIVRVNVRKILYVGCIKDYQYVYVDGEKEPLKIRLRMSALEESLGVYGFIRVHQGYILNYRYIKRIGTDDIELNDGQTIPLSRRKKQDVILKYMRLVNG